MVRIIFLLHVITLLLIPSASTDAEQEEHSYPAGGGAKGTATLENALTASYTVKYTLAT